MGVVDERGCYGNQLGSTITFPPPVNEGFEESASMI